jgi:hypothetical protein
MGHQADLIDVCVNLNLIIADERQKLIELLSSQEMRRDIEYYEGFDFPYGETNFEIHGKFLHFRFVDTYREFLHWEEGYRVGSKLAALLIQIVKRGGANYDHLMSFNSTGGGYYDVEAEREEEARRKEPHESQFFGWGDYEAQAESIPTMVLQAVLERRLKEG